MFLPASIDSCLVIIFLFRWLSLTIWILIIIVTFYFITIEDLLQTCTLNSVVSPLLHMRRRRKAMVTMALLIIIGGQNSIFNHLNFKGFKKACGDVFFCLHQFSNLFKLPGIKLTCVFLLLWAIRILILNQRILQSIYQRILF